MTNDTIELRCPVGPRRLFGKYVMEHGRVPIVNNLMEFACSDCKKTRKRLGLDVELILHRFDLAGTLVETVEVMTH